MTWSAQLRVVDLAIIDGDTEIVASAHVGDTYESSRVTGTNDDGEWITEAVTLPRIYSNTEGAIKSVFASITVEGRVEGIKVGDPINVTGHFQTQPKAEVAIAV